MEPILDDDWEDLINWESLIDALKEGQCAFFLGHGLITDPTNGRPKYANYCDELAETFKGSIEKYYKEENFYLFKEPIYNGRDNVTAKIKKFYASAIPQAPDIYQKLAEIQASIYISVPPDNYLENKLGASGQVAVYNDPGGKGQEILATKDCPVVYHIFGTVKNSASLVLSFDDLYDFFENILSHNTLPEAIKLFFEREKGTGQAIFLGISFKTWYMQLLLRLFHLSKTKNVQRRTAFQSGTPESEEMDSALQNFSVNYVARNPEAFVDKLWAKCKDAGILRVLNPEQAVAAAALKSDREARAAALNTQLERNRKLRDSYATTGDLSSDPKEKERCTLEIAKLDAESEIARKELNAFMPNGSS